MKYDKHHIDIILTSLALGDGRVNACKKADISYQTFTDWMDKVEFSEAIKKAEQTGNDKIKDICKRKIIEDKSWQSGAWWLERNYPEDFGSKIENRIKGEVKSHIEMSDEQVQKIIDALKPDETMDT